MSYQETYKDWLTWADEETKEELLRLTDEKRSKTVFIRIWNLAQPGCAVSWARARTA